MTRQEVDSVKWFLEVRKSTPTEIVDENYILANKRLLQRMVRIDIVRYENHIKANPMNSKAFEYLGFLTTLGEWLMKA